MFTKIKDVLKNQITQGSTAEKLSQSLVTGILIGCFPIIGVTTALSLLAGWKLRLNHIVLQTANHLMYPAQILLIPIYIKTASLFIENKNIPIRPDLILELFSKDKIEFLKLYALVGLYAAVIWVVISSLGFKFLYKIFLPIISKLKNKIAD